MYVIIIIYIFIISIWVLLNHISMGDLKLIGYCNIICINLRNDGNHERLYHFLFQIRISNRLKLK